jgi:hypothetical protein
MWAFLSGYANAWSRRHRFSGHVFQGRMQYILQRYGNAAKPAAEAIVPAWWGETTVHDIKVCKDRFRAYDAEKRRKNGARQ